MKPMKKTTKQIIAENLQLHLDINRISQTDLAHALGVTPAAVSSWIKGIAAPHANTIDKICRFFKISRDELLRDSDEVSSILAESKPIPLYNSIYRKQYFDVSNIERYLAVDKSIKADFGIIIYSESMSDAGINPGNVALFKKDFRFVDGRIYAVWISGEESVILKRVFATSNGYILESENKGIPPIVVENNNAFIIGELFGLFKIWRWD